MAEEEQQQRKEQPIIIKKKKGHGGHGGHGGAWKVAYADFVTAMMAFFIVMWILGQNDAVQKNVSSYFKDPGAFNFVSGKRTIPIDLNLTPVEGEGGGEGKSKHKFVFGFSDEMRDSVVKKIIEKAAKDSVKAAERVADVAKELKQYIQQEVNKSPLLKEILSSIKIEMTKEGLRIELIESSESLFFEVGSAKINSKAKDVLEKLSQEIGKLPNSVEIEGHTDSRKYGSGSSYGNWDLSADRANSARRIMESNGLWDGQITRVTGYADRKLRMPDNPFDLTNRRISILIKQLTTKTFLPNTPQTSGESTNE
jgi:chemotaxis protein MotB